MAERRGAQTKKGRARAAASKKTAGAGLRANRQAAEAAVAPEPLMGASVNRDLAGVLLAVFAVASFIAVISPTTAPVTRAVSSFFHFGFGLGAYVLPIAILLFAATLFLRDRSPLNLRTSAGIALIFLALIAMLSLMVPGTELSTVGMFTDEALVSSGGYVGAFIASTLQSALGKVIAGVVLVGIVIAGLVIIGFSISEFFRAAAERARALAERRHVDVNASPWGDEDAYATPPAAGPVQAQIPQPAAGRDAAARGSLVPEPAPVDGVLDDAPASQQKTCLIVDAPDDEDDDPFVDLSDQLAAEDAAGHAPTRLIPIADRYVDEVPAPPTRFLRNDGAQAEEEGGDTADAEDVDELPPFAVTGEGGASAETSSDDVPSDAVDQPIPAFLLQPKSGARVKAKRPAPASGKGAAADAAPEDAEQEEGLQLPPISILRHNPQSASAASSEKELEQTAASLQSTLAEFSLHSRVVGWISGPTVTTFKVQPGEGERVSRISNLEDDIALSLAAQSVRIFAPIPGTSLVGIEIPNRKRQNVNLGDVLPYVKGGPLELAIGRDAEGSPIVADLAKMPHLLIAGTTGSGKSVMINSIIMALLMRTRPEDVRLIMVDPKRVELAGYNGLPHLYVPVVTEPKQAASALQWAVSEMERRLKVFERVGVRKISTFNDKQASGAFDHYDNPPAKMPYLVIIIDELSDLMMVAGKDVEASIVRIAQLGRAAGIHLIVATQRPSSNVVTGLIKANITNRIAFNVATGIDSRVIIDQTGAEKLTGYGDMLFSKVDWGKPKRIQGCFVSDEEINQVVDFVKEQGDPDYHEEILSAVVPAQMGGGARGAADAPAEDDPLVWEAARIVVDSQLGSTSGLQRRLKVGYARAGRIMDMLEEKGVVGPPDGSKPREVLLDAEGLAALEHAEMRMAQEDELGGF